MRVSAGAAGTQRLWYRSNPTFIRINYIGDLVGPHGMTVRAQYTIPTGKIGFLHACEALAVRATAPGTPDTFFCGFGTTGQPWCEVVSEGENRDDGRLATFALGAMAPAGYTVQLYTEDFSVGGTVDYRIFVHIGLVQE